MAIIRAMTDDNYKEELAVPEPVLVDFWAPWCGPCRMVAPVVEAIAEKYQGRARVAKVNVDDNPLLANKYGIRGVPTLALFKEGRMVDQIVGAVPQSLLEERLERVLSPTPAQYR
jgi:thioredoxin 1